MAPATRANSGRKRHMPADEEAEAAAPITKKTKSNSGKAVATKAASTAIKQPGTKKATKSIIPKPAVPKRAPVKAAAKKPTSSKASTSKATKATGSKRKAANDDEDSAPVTKKQKTAAAKKAAPKKAVSKPARATKTKKAAAPKPAPQPKKTIDPVMKVKIGAKINSAPTQVLDVFVFGEGSAGELGLGHKRYDGKPVIDVKRPRPNPLLSAEAVGVVQIACGGMHVLALTRDNRILTWGVNDQGALGRDTKSDGEASDGDDDDDDSGLNRHESTPAEIDTKGVAPATKFVQVAASDSASFALTEDGRVYSWGTFRVSLHLSFFSFFSLHSHRTDLAHPHPQSPDGILGFSKDVHIQYTPVLLDEPRKVVSLATGSNHVLALDNRGKVQTWGAPEQNQLGRRVVQRDTKASALRAGGRALRRGVRVVAVAAGAYHSFALDDEGRAWAWGLNNFGQLGIARPEGEGGDDDEDDGAFGSPQDGGVVLEPAQVQPLAGGRRIATLIGGEHHTLAVADDGALFSFGRVDGHQLGFPPAWHTRENSIYGELGTPRVLPTPTRLVDIPAPVVAGDAGIDSNLVVTEAGRVFAWGFNGNYQCGIGETEGDVLTPALVDSVSVRDKKIVYAGCGGQFGIVASVHE